MNGPIVGAMGLFEQIPDAKKASDKNVNRYYERLNHEFASSQYVAGDRYSIGDISLVTAIDFASTLVDLKPAEDLEHLWRWHAEVSARPAVANN